MKKILILGAQGILGQALVEFFENHDFEVIAWGKAECNLLKISDFRFQISDFNPDIVINASALNAVDAIEEDDLLYEKAKVVNGTAVGELAGIAKEICATFVHYSTDYVFDGTAIEPYTEDITPNPISRYGETKLLGEKLVQEIGEKYYIIRLSRVFGKPGSGATSKQSFVDKMIELARKKEHLDIVDDQVSSPSYAPDVAELTHALLTQEKPFGIYHGANSGHCSWYEWAKKIFKLKNIDIDITPVPHTQFPRPASAPAFSVLVNTKMRAQQGWQEALEEYLK